MNIKINLTYILLFLFLCAFIFLFHNGFSLKLFSKHDNNVIDKFLNKFPLVNADFINKNVKEQNIENNQEIHELHKRITYLEQQIEKLSEELSNWKNT